MYSFNSRVRYSEVNSEKELTLPSLLDYLQDCCMFESEDFGVGRLSCKRTGGMDVIFLGDQSLQISADGAAYQGQYMAICISRILWIS